MNRPRAAGIWKPIEAPVKEQWGKASHHEFEELRDRGEPLAGKLQGRYGLARDDAERQAKVFRQRHNGTRAKVGR